MHPTPLASSLVSSRSIVSTSGTAALLLAAAGGLLSQSSTASAAPAPPTTYNETSAPGADFGNTFSTAFTLPATTIRQVDGRGNTNPDSDYFTFTGLPVGPFTLTITDGTSMGDGFFIMFQAFNDSGAVISNSVMFGDSDAPGTMKTISGTVPASGRLTIGVDPQSGETGPAPAYSTSLSVVPEPATTALVALGAAAVALAARRARKQAE